MSEQDDQAALFQAIRAHESHWPELRLAFHPPNEGRHTPAYRHKLALQGVRAGIPDVLFPARRGSFVGVAIELKVKPNHATPAQRAYLAALEAQGWLCRVCYGWEEAWGLLLTYLQLPKEGSG